MHKPVIMVIILVFTAKLLAFASAEEVERKQIVAVKIKTPPKQMVF